MEKRMIILLLWDLLLFGPRDPSCTHATVQKEVDYLGRKKGSTSTTVKGERGVYHCAGKIEGWDYHWYRRGKET
jgi:hypothetical protein